MDELAKLVSWMRATGVSELSYQGTFIRLAEGLPHASSESPETEPATPKSRPTTPGMCAVCGVQPVSRGIYAAQRLCQSCGWKDVTGAPA